MYFSLCQKCTIHHISVLSVSLIVRLSHNCMLVGVKALLQKTWNTNAPLGFLCLVSWSCLFTACRAGYFSNWLLVTHSPLVSCRHTDSTPSFSRTGFCFESGRISLSPALALLKFSCPSKMLKLSEE